MQRTPFTIALVLAAIACCTLAGLLLFARSPATRPPPLPPPAPAAIASPAAARIAESGTPPIPPSDAGGPPAPAPVSKTAPTTVEERIAELDELGERGDSEAVKILVGEVRNANSRIRRAALDALAQTGNREAVPLLVELAGQVEDPDQKEEILETAEFLRMPTISEALQQKGK